MRNVFSGVPKLNRSELETACEDFSNIIEAFDGYTVYKGTLSSGVEIAVASTAVLETREWTRAMEMTYRRKVTLNIHFFRIFFENIELTFWRAQIFRLIQCQESTTRTL